MKTVKLGVVGLGRGAIVSDIFGEESITLTAICDRNVEKLEKVSKEFAEKGQHPAKFTDFEDLLKADIDAVYIATDAIDHVSYVIRAMDAGKHVISEIPTVNSLESYV